MNRPYFNDPLRRFWQEDKPAVFLPDSHPYHEDGDRFVGERNRALERTAPPG